MTRTLFTICFTAFLWRPAPDRALLRPAPGPMSLRPAAAEPAAPAPLRVAPGGHYLETASGDPFFWLGDTGWLLLLKLKHDAVLRYLDARRQQGFNVIQVMVIHGMKDKDAGGHPVLRGGALTQPDTTEGGYWSNLDLVVQAAAERGIYLALVPLWGNNVKEGHVTPEQATAYGQFLTRRYGSKDNVIWMNGGDTRGSDAAAVWDALGNALHASGRLVTFHPRGRHSSSDWFAAEPWLDFNSVQSGHRRYDQDTSAGDPHYGEDNWRYIQADYAQTPAKPVLDAEPSYEGIPQGLHDTRQPRWTAADVRRYAYWSVFAGACGFTYGNNSVMQFHESSEKTGAYGATTAWESAIDDPGAQQMHYLRELMLSRPYFERVPGAGAANGAASAAGAASMTGAALTTGAAPNRHYDYVASTHGRNYAFFYTYTGRNFPVALGQIAGRSVKATWFDPRTGKRAPAGTYTNHGIHTFDPPGEPKPGNDWVLILDGI